MGQHSSKNYKGSHSQRHHISEHQSRHHPKHHPLQHHRQYPPGRHGPHPARLGPPPSRQSTAPQSQYEGRAFSIFKPIVTGKDMFYSDRDDKFEKVPNDGDDDIETNQMKNIAKHSAYQSVENIFTAPEDSDRIKPPRDGSVLSDDSKFNTSEIELLELGSRGASVTPPQHVNWSFHPPPNSSQAECKSYDAKETTNTNNSSEKSFVKSPIISGELFKATESPPISEQAYQLKSNENQGENKADVKPDVEVKQLQAHQNKDQSQHSEGKPLASQASSVDDSKAPTGYATGVINHAAQESSKKGFLQKDRKKKKEKSQKKKHKKGKEKSKKSGKKYAEVGKKDTCKERFFFDLVTDERLGDQQTMASHDQVLINKDMNQEVHKALTDSQKAKQLTRNTERSGDSMHPLHIQPGSDHPYYNDAETGEGIKWTYSTNTHIRNWMLGEQHSDNKENATSENSSVRTNQNSIISSDEKYHLVRAASSGDMDWLERLLHDGADPNCTHPMNRNTALHYAVTLDYQTAVSMVSLLLKYGADPNLCNYSGAAPLHDAIIHQQTSCVEVLLESGSDVNAVWTSANTTPINLAVHSGNPDSVHMLLQKGAVMSPPQPPPVPSKAQQGGSHIISNPVPNSPLQILVYKWKGGSSSSEEFASILRTLIEGEGKIVEYFQEHVSLWAILNKLHDSKHGHFATLELITIIVEMGYVPTAPEMMLIKTIDKAKHDWVLDYLNSPPPITDQCRRAIRRSLHPNVLSGVDKLSVSDQVKDQLLLLQESTEL